MRKILYRLFCTCCALLLQCGPARGDATHIIASEIPPMNFMHNGKLTGFCIDVAEEIQRRLGDNNQIELLPWTRAYQIAQREPHVILLCPKRTEEREHLFKWVGPLATSKTNLYAKYGTNITIKNLDAAKKASGILLPRGFYSYSYLRKQGFQNLEQVSDSITMLRMLLAGRQPLMAIDQQQLPALLAQGHADRHSVKNVYQVMSTVSYLTFSLGSQDQQVKMWQQTLDNMKRDGCFAKIYNKWFQNTDIGSDN